MLQWVHGPQTVVMDRGEASESQGVWASMGPRSSDRGYVYKFFLKKEVQLASMGPRSSDRGYGR